MKPTTKLIISIIIISLFSLYVFEIKFNLILYRDLKELEGENYGKLNDN